MNLEFYWDASSPYTYLASTQLDKMVERTGATIVYRPFFLGGVMKASGNTMPAANPYKAKYLLNDVARWRDHYGVKMLLPAQEVVFPVNTIRAMRVAVALGDEFAAPYMHAVMAQYWVHGNDLSEIDVVKAAIQEVGADVDAALAKAETQAVKDELRKNSDEAVERGAFGAPTWFVGEDMFWGNDRIEMIERRLRTA